MLTVITSVTNFEFVQKIVFRNAKFDQPKLTPGIENELWKLKVKAILWTW